MTAARVALIGLLATGAGGCLLFTDPVNTPPEVQLGGPEVLHRGEEGTFSAEVTDATRGERRFDWVYGEDCPLDLKQAQDSGNHRGPPHRREESTGVVGSFKYKHDGPKAYCVWVIVADARGARSFATRPVKIIDRRLRLNGPSPVHSGQPATFTAEYFIEPPEYSIEPDAAARSHFSWAMARNGLCADAEMAARLGTGEIGRSNFLFERAQRAPFCVAVAARDEFGIDRLVSLMVTALRIAAPAAAIRPVAGLRIAGPGPIGIFTPVRLAATAEGDLDPSETLEFTWKLTRPDGSTVVPAACPDARPAGSEVCFAPERRGMYRVDVAVADGTRRSDSPTYELPVADHAPCIRDTEPRFSSAPKFFEFYDRDRVLKVSEVHDDGDPWPSPGRASQRAFRWSIRKRGPGAARFERRVSAIFDTFTIPAREYQPGDQIEVRVEYWDRLDVEDPQARDFSGRCNPDNPVCELTPNSGCYQWITWTVEYL